MVISSEVPQDCFEGRAVISDVPRGSFTEGYIEAVLNRGESHAGDTGHVSRRFTSLQGSGHSFVLSLKLLLHWGGGCFVLFETGPHMGQALNSQSPCLHFRDYR